MEVPAHPKTSGVINSNLNTESDHMEIPALSRTGAITLCGLANEAKYVPLTTYNHTFKLFEIRSFSILAISGRQVYLAIITSLYFLKFILSWKLLIFF